MSHRLTLKDHQREARLFANRVVAATVLVLALVLALVARLVYLQVVHHAYFTTLSHDNRVQILPLAPTRGLIFDRNGTLVADNRPSFGLEVTPEQVPNLEQTLRDLRRIIAIGPADLSRFRRQLRRKRRFEGVPIRLRLSQEEVARFAVNRYRFPGVDIEARLIRYYPLGTRAAHVIGYVGRINEQELREVDSSNYSATRYIGKVGVESYYEDILHGRVGYQQVETNAGGRILRVLERTPPVPGNDLHLHLDMKVQEVAEDQLAGKRGAIVAIDPRDGALIAAASMPSYDPNPFVQGIDVKAYRELRDSPDRPLFNRALRGQYPPGSTIKPLVALAGLEYGVTTPDHSVYCPGWYSLKGSSHRYRDWKRGGHGTVNLTRAIVESCDVYFYDLAFSLGIDHLHEFLAHFGLGKKTGIDLSGERSGLLASRAWKRRVRNLPWFPGETLITGIGQGFTLVTPLQLAEAVTTLASRGHRYRPHMVASMTTPDGKTQPLEPEVVDTVPGRPAAWDIVIHAMNQVVEGAHGTARRISKGASYSIAGKTGTAQVFGLGQDQRYDKSKVAERLQDHALFMAFAPVEAPTIAVAVIVENGGHGGSAASPLARAVMDQYLLGKVIPQEQP